MSPLLNTSKKKIYSDQHKILELQKEAINKIIQFLKHIFL